MESFSLQSLIYGFIFIVCISLMGFAPDLHIEPTHPNTPGVHTVDMCPSRDTPTYTPNPSCCFCDNFNKPPKNGETNNESPRNEEPSNDRNRGGDTDHDFN